MFSRSTQDISPQITAKNHGLDTGHSVRHSPFPTRKNQWWGPWLFMILPLVGPNLSLRNASQMYRSSKAFIGPIPSWVWAALRLKQSISMSAPRHVFSHGVTRGPKRTWPGCGKSGGRWLMWIDSSMIFNECFGVPRFWYPQTPKLDPPQLPMYGVSLEGHQGDWGLRAYSSLYHCIFLCLMWLKPPENATERNGMVDPKAIDPIDPNSNSTPNLLEMMYQYELWTIPSWRLMALDLPQ